MGLSQSFQIMAGASFTPKEKFHLMAIIDAIPTQWRHHLKKSVQRSRLYQPHNESIQKSTTINWIGRRYIVSPSEVAIGSRSREFEFKVLHRNLATNKFLHNIDLAPSFLCTFCKTESESIEHHLIECEYSNKFCKI